MTARDPAEPGIEVSVILCVRDGAVVLPRQLAALDAQIDHPAFEVVVVDNGSRDASRQIAEAWASGAPRAADSVTVVSSGSAPSIPRSRNTGALHARGRVLAFCDADDQVDERWVAALAAAVDGDVLAAGHLLPVGPDGSPRPLEHRGGPVGTTYLPYAPTSCCALPRSVYRAVGGFDESLPAYGFEDVDFSWRVQEAGYRLVDVPEAIVTFQLSGYTASIRKRFALGRGRVLMAQRYPLYDQRPYGLLLCTGDILRDAALLVSGSLRARAPDTERAGRLVASLGRAVGWMSTRRGVPRRLLPPATDGAP